MVALAGRGWSLAPSLRALFDEADRRWPKRSRISDGSIGDRAHAARTSDHNPDASGDVLAGDLTDDKANGCDADLFAEHLRKSRDPRVKYVICNGKVFRSYGSSAWKWTPYTGANAHEKHTHVSILDTPEAKNDLSPWFPYADAQPVPPLTQPRRHIVDTFPGPDGVLHTVLVGSDSQVYKITGDPATAPLEPLGGAAVAVSGAFSHGVCTVTAVGVDGKLYVTKWTGNGWTPWDDHPTARLAA